MVIGALVLELFFPHARSLKDKRHILKGFKERIRRKYNVALAELDYQDLWQRARLGVVTISAEARLVEEILGRVLSDADEVAEAEVAGSDLRFF